MRKIYFILIALMVIIAFTFSNKAIADTPGQISIQACDVPLSDCNDLCAPLNTIVVKLINGGLADFCMTCPTWKVSIWESDGSSLVQIGADQVFSGGSYTWTGSIWDSGTYPYVVLIWHYYPGTGCGFTMTDGVYSQTPPSNASTVTFTDKYPCQ